MTAQPSRSVIGRSIAAAGNTSERRAQAKPIATKPTNAIRPVRKCGGTAAIIPSTNVPTRNASPTLIVVRKNVPQPGGNRLWVAVSPSSTKRCQRTMNTVPNTAKPARDAGSSDNPQSSTPVPFAASAGNLQQKFARRLRPAAVQQAIRRFFQPAAGDRRQRAAKFAAANRCLSLKIDAANPAFV